MNFSRLFVNPADHRLRTVWRIALTILVTMGLFLPAQFLLKKIVPSDLPHERQIDILLACFSLFATITITLSRRWIDRRPVRSLGLATGRIVLRDTLAGFLISFTMVAVIVLVEVSFGWLEFRMPETTGPELWSGILYLLLVTGLAVGWWENLFFIGYLFQNMQESGGLWRAAIFNCVLFGLIHAANPNATPMAVIGIILIHSYEIYSFVRTSNLWLVLGIHAGWNFFQGLFGFAVSGRKGIQGLEQINTTPDWLGGGPFGPEAGAIMIVTTALAYLLIAFYARKAGSTRLPRT